MQNKWKLGLTLFTSLFLTSCLQGQSGSGSSGTEERFLQSGSSGTGSSSQQGLGGPAAGNGGASGNGGAWSGLNCSQANLSDIEEAHCKLDSILQLAQQYGGGLQSVGPEIKDWINDPFIPLRAQYCSSSPEITHLVVGSVYVVASRGFLVLPIGTSGVSDPVLRAFLQEVVKITIAMGCKIDPNSLALIMGNSNNVGGGTSGTSGGGGSLLPAPPSGGPSNVVCAQLQSRYEYVCQPYCVNTNTCNVQACDDTVLKCQANNCNCH